MHGWPASHRLVRVTDPIELLLCWRWSCPSCMATNYEPGQELTAEDAAEADIDADDGEMVAQPTSVLCKGCMAYFPVRDPSEA